MLQHAVNKQYAVIHGCEVAKYEILTSYSGCRVT